MRARVLRTSTFRLALLYLALFGGSVAILLAFIYWTTTGFIERQTIATLRAEVDGLAEHYRGSGLRGLAEIVAARSSPERGPGGLYLLTTPGRERLAGNLRNWPDAEPGEDGLLRFNVAAQVGGAEVAHYPVLAQTFVLQGQIHLLVGRDLRERAAFEAMLIESLSWAGAVTLVLGLLGGVVMSRRMLARLDAVNRTSQRIVAGDLRQRVAVSGSGDEFDQLSANLNAMLDKIERLIGGMREVTDNIAHDLRSPLTRIRARLEELLREDFDRDQYRAAVERAIAEAGDLLNVFNALLGIAEVEAGAARAELAPLALDRLLEETAELFEPAFEDAGLKLETDVASGAEIMGHRQLLVQALSNLLDNALKYAGAGARVRLAAYVVDARPTLAVVDEGPGVPAAMRDKVLQRSVRLDPSRSTPGHGLGLSMVAAVARLHGADLMLDDGPGGRGLRVRLVFPATRL